MRRHLVVCDSCGQWGRLGMAQWIVVGRGTRHEAHVCCGECLLLYGQRAERTKGQRFLEKQLKRLDLVPATHLA